MRLGSLFAGIGGFDLAARWMGWETAWFSEIDPYASAVLQKHWPGVPNHGDIMKIDFTQVEPVDMLCGGFPCQPNSNAGKRRGTADERWLWPQARRAIRDLRPRGAVLENVPGLLSVNDGFAMGEILGDLAELGYDAEWTVLSAAEVGAPHLRKRVWLVAHDGTHGLQGRDRQGAEGWCLPRIRPPALPGEAIWRPLSPPYTVRNYDGLLGGVDRIGCLGNSIVPQCALTIFQAIQAAEERQVA